MNKKVKDAQLLIANPVFNSVVAELKAEAFEAWTRTESVDDREKIFFRVMAIEDIYDSIKVKADYITQLEVVENDGTS